MSKRTIVPINVGETTVNGWTKISEEVYDGVELLSIFVGPPVRPDGPRVVSVEFQENEILRAADGPELESLYRDLGNLANAALKAQNRINRLIMDAQMGAS